ncbi:cobalamin-binding protein [Cytobacillus spongiae]|jgi:iron complex transport system substrate-binding protein|uniref:cobalamin-binding protein n=1 Tax=Cytobacillus spongiae TaxID=2901381 RepID=UPI001F2B02F3|nr:cobalamin-binding protein [Cytobacillus spongiae]UII55393.1 cobalamin-binding protein [Cytobacillus spongiae]
MRVISICPSNTELIAYMNRTDCLVGIDDYSDWPESIHELPRLGPDLSINMDLVEELRPDMVLASLSVPGMEKNIAELEKRRIPHIVLNPQSLEDIEKDLITTGKAINDPAAGLQAAIQFRSKIEEIREIGLTIQAKPTLYWEWWPKPVFTPGKHNWLTEISEMIGAKNLFQEVELASVQTDWVDVSSRNPDFICLAWVGVRQEKVNMEIVKKRPGWDQLDAVQQNQIFILEEALYCRPSPRLVDGAIQLAKLLHSKEFAHI